jgi:hypothetical protein
MDDDPSRTYGDEMVAVPGDGEEVGARPRVAPLQLISVDSEGPPPGADGKEHARPKVDGGGKLSVGSGGLGDPLATTPTDHDGL